MLYRHHQTKKNPYFVLLKTKRFSVLCATTKPKFSPCRAARKTQTAMQEAKMFCSSTSAIANANASRSASKRKSTSKSTLQLYYTALHPLWLKLTVADVYSKIKHAKAKCNNYIYEACCKDHTAKLHNLSRRGRANKHANSLLFLRPHCHLNTIVRLSAC